MPSRGDFICLFSNTGSAEFTNMKRNLGKILFWNPRFFCHIVWADFIFFFNFLILKWLWTERTDPLQSCPCSILFRPATVELRPGQLWLKPLVPNHSNCFCHWGITAPEWFGLQGKLEIFWFQTFHKPAINQAPWSHSLTSPPAGKGENWKGESMD